ncbi:MAG TPA: hypothetical protein PLP14_11165, partial [Chitinophagaceae bacterium]|nr:hypothetical protein [Chitinophagaceae bacterium]
MKQLKLSVLFLFCLINAFGQNPGDTLTVQTFQYGSTTRDTVVHFPDTPGLQIEKVLMLYNIRCKNGLVSPPTAGQTNLGCGEWDYSCNTYVTDSSRVDSMYSSRPSHTVSNFSGSIYPYTTTPYYQLYQYPLTQSNFSIVSETQFSSGSGSIALSQVLDAAKKSGRSQFLFTATELINLGMSGGDIAGIILQAQNNADVFFMKVQMKNTSLTQLDPAEPELLGLNEVFNNHVSFVNGANRIQFYTPFNWD